MVFARSTEVVVFIALIGCVAVGQGQAQDSSLSFESFDAKSSTELNLDGVMTERIQQRYASGKLHIERQVALDAQGNYVNHGEYQQWSESGDFVVSGNYQMGKQEGHWIRFCNAQESQLFQKDPYRKFKSPFQSSVEFRNGKMNGFWTITDKDGKTVSQIQLSDALRDGPAIWYHPNGQVMWQSEYRQGALDGSFVEYDPSGKLIRAQQYHQGRRIEQKKSYHANGQVKAEYEYLTASQRLATHDDWNLTSLAVYESSGEPLKHGQHRIYYENGAVRSVATYSEGQLIGDFESWYPNGQREVVGSYRDGAQQGNWNWWHPNGMRKATLAYQDGRISSEIMAWNDTGLRISNGAIDDPSKQFELAHPNPSVPTRVQTVGSGGQSPQIK